MKYIRTLTYPTVFLVTLMGFLASGCNTANGFGKDVQKAGEGIQDGTK
jgi:predicted small secreted protein